MRVAAAILAAGASRRLGRPKQLEAPDGEALVRRACRAALEAGCDPVLAVLGCGASEVGAALGGLPLTLLPNPHWEEGMASSVRSAVAALSPEADALLLLVCDQVELEPGVLRGLLAAFRAAPGIPAACLYGGLPGVPAVFPRPWLPALASLRGDQGARALLRAGPVTLHPWEGGLHDRDR